MAFFVLNEWVWEDLRGANSPQHQSETLALLRKLATGTDVVIVVAGSKFEEKLYGLCKSGDPMHGIAVRFFKSLLWDSTRCRRLEQGHLDALPDDLAAESNPDDHYLLQAQQSECGSTVVTTDGPLLDTLRRRGLACAHRDEWLPAYVRT